MLETPIGRGGMGEVWLGRSYFGPGLSKIVAIKRIASGHADSAGTRKQFQIEAKASLGLRHPNIVYVFDFLKIDGQDCIVMEWVKGVNLAELISHQEFARRASLCAADAVFVVVSVLRALEYTHRLQVDKEDGIGLIHRDVSPHNILLSTLGEVKLSDFGVARLLGAQSTAGGPKGKLAYMAPEQLHREHDERVDVYSAGAVLYELLSGTRYQFDGGEPGAQDEVDVIVNSLARHRVDRGLGYVVAQMLRQRPGDRIRSARSALVALHPFEPRDSRSAAERLGHAVSAEYFRANHRSALHSASIGDSGNHPQSIVAHQLHATTQGAHSHSPIRSRVAEVSQGTYKTPGRWSEAWMWFREVVFQVLCFLLLLLVAWYTPKWVAKKYPKPIRKWSGSPFPTYNPQTRNTLTDELGEWRVQTAAHYEHETFGMALETAKRASLVQLRELLSQPEPFWDSSGPRQSQLESLVSFHLRLSANRHPDGMMDVRWIAGCALRGSKNTQEPSSCRAVRSLFPSDLLERFPDSLPWRRGADSTEMNATVRSAIRRLEDRRRAFYRNRVREGLVRSTKGRNHPGHTVAGSGKDEQIHRLDLAGDLQWNPRVAGLLSELAGEIQQKEWEERLALQSLNGESVWMRLSEAYSELVTTQYRQTRGDSVSGAAGYH